MTKPKDPPKTTGRKKYRYVGIPEALYQELEAFCQQDLDERSVSWGAKKAIREFLDREKAGSQKAKSP